MTLQRCADLSAADWIVDAAIPWMQLIAFGPAGFGAYARLRYIPDPTAPDQAESDAGIAEDHPSDSEQAQRALNLLGRFTRTPEDCYFGVWDGWFDVGSRPTVLAGPMVVVPNRQYFLLRGSLADLDTWDETLGSGSCLRPDFAWPADHSWCFASDVDPHWAGIGADQAAIDALLNEPKLDAVPARPADPQPRYY